MERKSILIIEDDADWRALLFSYLAGSYDVMAIGEYASALNIIRRRSFDLIILDLRLEDEDDENFQGMDLLAFLREKESGADWDTKVIVVSAYGKEQQVREAFKIRDVFDYIDKHEFDKREFQDTVCQAVGEKGRSLKSHERS